MKLKIGIYGASNCGKVASEEILKILKNKKLDLVFIDSDKLKIGSVINGLNVYEPSIIFLKSLDYLLISSSYDVEIFNFVFGILDKNKIFFNVINFFFLLNNKFKFKKEIINQKNNKFIDVDIRNNFDSLVSICDINTTAFTICSNNHISYAITVAKSFLKIHNNSIFYIFITDNFKISSYTRSTKNKKIKFIFVEDLNIDDYKNYCFKYNKYELCTALRPILILYLFKKCKVKQVIMLDPDMLILSSFKEILQSSKNHSILIFPHQVTTNINEINSNELSILKSGIFNCGLMIFNKCRETNSFLIWWKNRLKNYCLDEISNGLFVDQLWINFVPTLFKNCRIVRDKEYNIAYWNLNERNFKLQSTGIFIDGTKINSFHFSGINNDWNRAEIDYKKKHL